MRIALAPAPPADAQRARALIDACGLEIQLDEADGPQTDALVVVGELPAAVAPLVWIVDDFTAEVAGQAHLAGARVCLWRHGAPPLRQALLGAAEDAAATRAARATEQVRALVRLSVSDSIFRLSVEGDRFRFREINAAFTKATGLGEHMVLGRWVDEIIPEPSLSLVLSRYRAAIAERRTVRWQEVTNYPTGRKIGEVSITPLLDGDGRAIQLVGTVHDMTEEYELDQQLRQYAELVRAVQISLSIWDVGEAIALAGFNPESERITALDLATYVGKPATEIVPSPYGEQLAALLREAASGGAMRELPPLAVNLRDGGQRTFAVKAFPLSGGRVGLACDDITAEAQARALKAAENRVLEMVAAGRTLEDTMTVLAMTIEELAPPSIASVLILAHDGETLLHSAAPHLPDDYNRAVHGSKIGPRAGSCGTAASLRRPVIVTDIQTDPLWADYQDLARAAGMRACWSTPILSADGRVLGTFALYYRAPRAPRQHDLELIDRARHVAGIAIQRHELDAQLRGLSARLEAAREEERTGIAREIHDQLGQTITALKLELAWIARRATSAAGLPREGLLDKVASLSSMTDEIIDQVRRISAELRPGILDDLGLAAALSWQAQEFEGRTHIPTVVRAELGGAALSRDMSTAVFRVFQEALTNIVRHAEATHVDVRVAAEDGAVVLDVRDDGVGIRQEDVSDPRSLGLLGMRERARRLGGSATFAAAAPHGTLVTLRLPLAMR